MPDATFGSHAKVGLVPNKKGDQSESAIVVVLPDGHLAIAVKLTEGPETVQVLESYFNGFLSQGDWHGHSGSSRNISSHEDMRLGSGAAYVKSLL